jgi:LruC domain-containing protein
MKIIPIMLVLSFLSLQGLMAQGILLNFESGNRSYDMSRCWDNYGVNYTSSGEISGNWSGLTVQLNSGENYPAWIKSPWVIPAQGNVTLQVRLSGGSASSRGVTVLLVPYLASDPSGEGEPQQLYRHVFPNPRSTSLLNVSVAIPQDYVQTGLPCRILVHFWGSGGSGRAYVDQFYVPGTYHSDPSRGCIPLPVLDDRDADGVEDDEDAYPDDRYRAYNQYFPSSSTLATLLFEDKWPGRGDYDFNDLVLYYRIQTVTDALNRVVEQKYTFTIRAIGAWYRNGFGFQLMGVSPSSVRAVSGTSMSGIPYPVPDTEYVTEYHFASNGLESAQTLPTVIVFDDAFRVIGTENVLMNTDPTLAPVATRTLNVTVTFMQNGVPGSGGAVSLSQLPLSQFNPFLVSNGDRRREVHQAHFPPSSLAVTTVFGMIDDTSVPDEGRYYVTALNHPWVLNIPYQIPYPVEKRQLDAGYLKFLDWVVSGGVLYPDWYMDKPGYRNNDALY